MKISEWLRLFQRHRDKSLFSLSDLLVLTGEGENSLKVQLTRLTGAGIVNRAAEGWYENPFNPPSREEIAMVLRYPSYLSLEYALSKHGTLGQRVNTLTLMTTRGTYRYSTSPVYYEYHHVKPGLFFGYREEGGVLTAEPEKALLDLVYIRVVHSREMSLGTVLSLIDDMEAGDLDPERLSRYGAAFGGQAMQVLAESGLPMEP